MDHTPDYVILNESLISSVTYNASNSSNITNITDAFTQQWSFEFSVTLACIMSVSAFCTVVGNCMVLMVIIRHRGMRTRTNLFLLNLAITDLLVGLFVEPFSITTLIQNDWIFGQELCMLNGWMNGFCLITSFHTLMYISIHKYFSIVRPLSNPLKLTYIIGMMIMAWLWAAVLSTLNMLVLIVEYKPGTSQCGPRYPRTPTTFIVHGVFQTTVILIPAIIMVFCYVRMFIEIKKHSQRLRTNSTVEEDFILSQQKKVTITLFIVLATFVMMALPYHLYAMYTTFEKDKEHFPSFINPLAYMFLYLSSMCNPIIYAFRSPAFREGYKEILCQTPNYVISDESDQVPRTRRLSSLISSFRRTSSLRTGKKNVINCSDNKALTTKSTEREEKRVKPKFNRQKSLLELLRSTRQSSAQSVVHHNGDIIIMKEGKIVSVRRGEEGSPFLARLRTLAETKEHGRGLTAGLAGTGHVMFSLVCDGIAEGGDDILLQDKNLPEMSNNAINQTLVKQNIDDHTKEQASGCTGNATVTPHFKKKLSKEEKNCNELKYSQSSKTDDSRIREQTQFPATAVHKVHSDSDISEVKNGVLKTRNKLPCLLKSCDNESTTVDAISSLHNSSGLVIHVGDDDDILSVMPLTPNTREYLAKSDMHLSQNDPWIARSLEKVFGSSENVLKKPPTIQRLPSLEFLDPPVHLFRSHSNVSVHFSANKHRGRSKSPGKKERSKSPDVWSSSKASYLRSTFSSRSKATHV